MSKNNRAGQGLLEFIVLFLVVIAVLLTMKPFLTRAVQAKYKDAGDTFGQGDQFEPGVTRVVETITTTRGDSVGGGR